ncbi:MAG TPA: type II toxin-antitoxin system VapC family toxin [Candidatus Baltobacteraceae bacterium]|nr:type II toxin-antitoxin system VapC family toxin [Candidatus Baltobacteraceae bacterium]
MTTALDTNVVIALWHEDDALNSRARSALDSALARGRLVASAPVFAELLASPTRNEAFVDYFLKETAITVEWNLEEQIWRSAGRAFQAYVTRRDTRRSDGPRRILADFIIGAHALRRGYRLLTLDDRLYRAAFPALSIVRV